MGGENMKLIYVWIEKFRNIEKCGFQLSKAFNIIIEDVVDGSKSVHIDGNGTIFNIYGSNISNITAIVGKNCAGKSNFLTCIGDLHTSFDKASFILIYYDKKSENYIIEANLITIVDNYGNKHIEEHESYQPKMSTYRYKNGRIIEINKEELIKDIEFITIKQTLNDMMYQNANSFYSLIPRHELSDDKHGVLYQFIYLIDSINNNENYKNNEIEVKVIEHRAEVKKCPKCRRRNTGKFPDGITNTVQYGDKVKAIAVYLTQYQLIPYKHGTELIKDMFGISLSQGTMVNFNNRCNDDLEPIENNIKDSLTNHTSAVHFDETGIYIDKKRQWIHVASNDKYTYYQSHEKRGQIATDEINILPNFTGTVVHDCFRTYHKYSSCEHALCNAHILRELNPITELEKQKWAEPMKNLLLDIKKEVDSTWNDANAVTLDKIEAFENRYAQILKDGFKEDYIINSEIYSEKKVKKSTSLNLLNRLSAYAD